MENRKGFEDLRRTYFWQQKRKEIGLFLLIVIAMIFGPYFVGVFANNIFPDDYCEGISSPMADINCDGLVASWEYWDTGLMFFILLALFCALVGAFWMIIKEWINNNWEKADERARETLKINVRG